MFHSGYQLSKTLAVPCIAYTASPCVDNNASVKLRYKSVL